MMFVRGVTLTLATMLGFGIAVSSAEADHLKRHRRPMVYDNYYAGPTVVHRMPGLRMLFGDYALSEEEFDALYGTGDDNRFDESYYEPEPSQSSKLKKKSVAKTVPPKILKPAETASIDPAKKPVVKPKIISVPQDDEEKTVPDASSAAGMSCDKAGSIIGGYGFTAVKPESCKGKTYAFNATRDGKAFAIKLDAGSGELTEVKKLK